MTKKKSAKRAFICSFMSFVMCFAMLAGTTFAWFTDSVTSAGNKIISGKLDLELWKYDETAGAYVDISDSQAPIFQGANLAQNSTATLWEPGKTQIAYLQLKNAGNLALKYQVALETYNIVKNLDKAMLYKIEPDAVGPNGVTAWVPAGAQSVTAGTQAVSGQVPMQPGDVHNFALVIHMDENAGNEYMEGEIDFDLKILATQYTYESDSFNNQYDANANGNPDNADFPVENAAGAYNAPVTLTTNHATVTVPAGAEANGAALTENDSINLTVMPGTPDSNLQIAGTSGTTTYEVTLTNQNGKKVTSATGIKVELDIGVVDLQHFYHNATEMTKVDSLDAVALNKYYYDQTAGKLTFITDSFSPFTAEYFFDGGLGTEAHPYLIGTYYQLVNVDVGIGSSYPENGTDKIYYKVTEDINFAAKDGNNWAHSWLTGDPRTFAIDLGGKTITLGSKNMYGYARNIEIYNGTIAYTGVGTAVVGYACYQDVDSYNLSFHDLTLAGTIIGNGGTHYGPLIAYAFGAGYRNGDTVVISADNIVNNLSIASSNSDGCVGGLFGYVQGTQVTASVTNCTFNGTVVAPHASAFLNNNSYPNGGAVTSTGNVMNGTLIGSKDARAFGCNGNVTGGSAALTALNNSVTLGANAAISTIAASTDLFTVDADNQVIVKDVDAATYRAAVVFSVGQGYPRFITKDFDDTNAATYASGIYKYDVINETSDGSASGTLIENYNGTIIWLADGAYHFYSADFDVTSVNATLYVYAYDASGNMIAYQSLAYRIA